MAPSAAELEHIRRRARERKPNAGRTLSRLYLAWYEKRGARLSQDDVDCLMVTSHMQDCLWMLVPFDDKDAADTESHNA